MPIIIPKALKKSPLISVSFEFRFEGVEPYNDLFASKIAAAASGGNFDKMTGLPINQIPEFVRGSQMAFEPILGFKYSGVDVLVGSKVVVVRTPLYNGWNNFSAIVLEVANRIRPYVVKFIRIGFRSIDFFEGHHIDDCLNLSVSTNIGGSRESLQRENCSFAITYIDGVNRVRLNYANDASVIDNKKVVRKGSIVDVDAFCDNPETDVNDVIATIHDLGKRVFFESLKEDFIKTMEPVYD